jgi:RimJ/RimL family protein N-acetyltransferase
MEQIKTITKNNLTLTLQLMDTTNESEINKFLIGYYKSFGLRNRLDIRWFNWFYNDNPLGKCQNFLLTNNKNEIIGAFGFSIFEYYSVGVSRKGVIGVNGFINPDYTGQGLYTTMISESLQEIHEEYDIAFSYPHSNNIASVKGHTKSGWEYYKKIYFYKAIPSNVTESSADDYAIDSRIEDLLNYDFSKKTNSFLVKNYDWIKWRFKERPDKKYNLIINLNKNGTFQGYLIYTMYHQNDNSIRCQVADYDYKDVKVFESLLSKINQVAFSCKCSTLEFLVNEDCTDTTILTQNSFIKKEESYDMFVNGDLSKFNLDYDFKFEYGYFDVI